MGRRLSDLPLALHHRPIRAARAGGALQSSASRGGPGAGLPLLSHLGGEVLLRGHPAHRDVHDLSFAGVDGRAAAGAGTRQPGHTAAAASETSQRFAGLRVFQSFHSRPKRHRLLHLPRAGGPNAANVEGAFALHAVVPGLSSRAGEEPPSTRPDLQHGMDAAARPGQTRPGAFRPPIISAANGWTNCTIAACAIDENRRTTPNRRARRQAGPGGPSRQTQRRSRPGLLAEPGRNRRNDGISADDAPRVSARRGRMVGQPGTPGFSQNGSGDYGPGRSGRMHQAAHAGDLSLREGTGGNGVGRAALLCQLHVAGGLRHGGAGEKPGRTPDQSGWQPGAPSQPGRVQRLDAGVHT